MFLRKKVNKSGVISVQIIDKSSGKYKVYKTIGSSNDSNEVDSLVLEGRRMILEFQKAQEFDFTDYRKFTLKFYHLLFHKELLVFNLFLVKYSAKLDSIKFKNLYLNIWFYIV